MHRIVSRLQKLRLEYRPILPKMLENLSSLQFATGERTSAVANSEEIKALFPKTFGRSIMTGKSGSARDHSPLRVGVVLSGGQAAGGHNVIAGLFDALQTLHSESRLVGFLGGPGGIVDAKSREITHHELENFRNQGGFDLIGSGRTKIESEEQLHAALKTVTDLNLDGLVVIGGDDSNTNAAALAEFFLKNGAKTAVIGVPKTIDGDLKNAYVATSFGFDTATKIYAEMIGNIARDALSAKKYTHFIKLMGRSASHITLECALKTHPNITLIGEEIAAKGMSLRAITEMCAEAIAERSERGKDYGIILVPEGLIEFIPEMRVLMDQLNNLAAEGELALEKVASQLTGEGASCFAALPEEIQKQLLLDRDPHGNVQVSKIETEKLLILAVEKLLKERKAAGTFKGKFAAQAHFFGYEGRSAFPSNFDAQYCYALGHVAAALIDQKFTGYMASIQGLEKPSEEWEVSGLPITMLMNMEMRHGKEKAVIQKALVDLEAEPFRFLKENRQEWTISDHYRYPGPIQFFGERELTDTIPLTLQL